VIYFGGLTPIGVRIRSQMDKLGIKAVFDGTSGIVSDAFIQGLGPLAEGTLAFREGAPTDKLPGGKFFMEKYNAQKYDNPPEAYGAFAYAAMDMILDSIEKVGPDRKKVIAELANVKDRDTIVGKITFDDHGQNTVPVITRYVVQDGKCFGWLPLMSTASCVVTDRPTYQFRLRPGSRRLSISRLPRHLALMYPPTCSLPPTR